MSAVLAICKVFPLKICVVKSQAGLGYYIYTKTGHYNVFSLTSFHLSKYYLPSLDVTYFWEI